MRASQPPIGGMTFEVEGSLLVLILVGNHMCQALLQV